MSIRRNPRKLCALLETYIPPATALAAAARLLAGFAEFSDWAKALAASWGGRPSLCGAWKGSTTIVQHKEYDIIPYNNHHKIQYHILSYEIM